MIAQNVAAIVADHVRLTAEAIDRMYLNVYVPRAAVRLRGGGFSANTVGSRWRPRR